MQRALSKGSLPREEMVENIRVEGEGEKGREEWEEC
jgi:hypothetical protein